MRDIEEIRESLTKLQYPTENELIDILLFVNNQQQTIDKLTKEVEGLMVDCKKAVELKEKLQLDNAKQFLENTKLREYNTDIKYKNTCLWLDADKLREQLKECEEKNIKLINIVKEEYNKTDRLFCSACDCGADTSDEMFKMSILEDVLQLLTKNK